MPNPTPAQLDDWEALASVGAFEPGRNGNYGYAHDPADESRNRAERDEARIKVCTAVPALITLCREQEEKLKRLRELQAETVRVLRPFAARATTMDMALWEHGGWAKFVDSRPLYDGGVLTIGDLRAARSLHAKMTGGEG